VADIPQHEQAVERARTLEKTPSMKTILVAHREEAFAEQLTAELRKGGYHVIDCSGPWPTHGALHPL
jgi:hypothetical protein